MLNWSRRQALTTFTYFSLLFSFDLLNPVRTQRGIDHSSSNPSLFLRMTLPLSSSISSVAGVAPPSPAAVLSGLVGAPLPPPPLRAHPLARAPPDETLKEAHPTPHETLAHDH